MWKDFFYFSKGQRTAIVILLALILLVFVLNIILPYLIPEKKLDGKEFLNEAKEFKRGLASRDSLKKLQWQEKYRKEYQNYKFDKTPATSYTLFNFDPNKADSTTFIKLGLHNYIASNILKFRQKGGIFKTKDSFAKVYGISPEKFKELEPYITIAEIAETKKDTIPKLNKSISTNYTVELNSADTTELMKVSGIGPGYAKGIVRFRKSVGGFNSVEQLKEIYGMTESNFQKIKPFCNVNKALIQRINVNTASVERLNAHPYISFYQAKAIYELRRNKGKLKNINDLTNLEELNAENLAKIEAYLSFD